MAWGGKTATKAVFSFPIQGKYYEAEESATKASEDVIQVSQLPQLATKADIAGLEARLIKWMVGSLFVFACIIIAGIGILFQILLSPGVAQ